MSQPIDVRTGGSDDATLVHQWWIFVIYVKLIYITRFKTIVMQWGDPICTSIIQPASIHLASTSNICMHQSERIPQRSMVYEKLARKEMFCQPSILKSPPRVHLPELWRGRQQGWGYRGWEHVDFSRFFT